ncbi:MAG: RNA-binding S4 domain-containing protein [Alphaproteobacteria bacterium]|nr:RNA-binding S4 domain-containing protein [Alphaproteobacteria bacterium]
MTTGAGTLGTDTGTIRLDKWLWQARFFKSRTLASRLCAEGRVRIGGRIVDKAHHPVRSGDVLTFPQARTVRAVRIVALGTRRGPPAEARGLYADLLVAAATATAEATGATAATGATRESRDG